MTGEIAIRPAIDEDREFVAQFASSLLKFGSPAWKHSADMAPGFRKVLGDAMTDRGERAVVLIAPAWNALTLPTWPSAKVPAGWASGAP